MRHENCKVFQHCGPMDGIGPGAQSAAVLAAARFFTKEDGSAVFRDLMILEEDVVLRSVGSDSDPASAHVLVGHTLAGAKPGGWYADHYATGKPYPVLEWADAGVCGSGGSAAGAK